MDQFLQKALQKTCLQTFGGLSSNLRFDTTNESTMTAEMRKEKTNTSEHISCLMRSYFQAVSVMVCAAYAACWGVAEC